MDKLARKVDIHHAAMQGSYFAGFSAIWGFGPVLLLYLGLSNSTLGVVTSLALVLPLLLQPALAALSDADSRWTSRRLALVLSLLTLAAAVVMTVSTGSKTVLVAAYAVIGVLLVSTSPFFNSMVMEYHLRGVNVNYGLGRGTGSTTYAIVALVLGFVLEKRAPTVILPVLLAALVLQIIAVWTFRYPLPPVPAAQEEEPPKVLGLWALLKKYPAFPVMLMGCALLQGGHNACNTYMIHIVDKVGAGESLMGVVLAVVGASVCGGGGVALVGAGPVGMIAGAAAGILLALVGKSGMEKALVKAKLPLLVRRLVTDKAVKSGLSRQRDEIEKAIIKALADPANGFSARLCQSLSQTLGAQMERMAKDAEMSICA